MLSAALPRPPKTHVERLLPSPGQLSRTGADGAPAAQAPLVSEQRSSKAQPALSPLQRAARDPMPHHFVRALQNQAALCVRRLGLQSEEHVFAVQVGLAKASTTVAARAVWQSCHRLYLRAAALADVEERECDSPFSTLKRRGTFFIDAFFELIDASEQAGIEAYAAMAEHLPWSGLTPTQAVKAHQMIGLVPAPYRARTFARAVRQAANADDVELTGADDSLIHCGSSKGPLLRVALDLHVAYGQTVADDVLGRSQMSHPSPPFDFAELRHWLPDKSSRRRLAARLAVAKRPPSTALLRAANAYLPRLGTQRRDRAHLLDTLLQVPHRSPLMLMLFGDHVCSLRDVDKSATPEMLGDFFSSLLMLVWSHNFSLWRRLWDGLFGTLKEGIGLAPDFAVERRAQAMVGLLRVAVDAEHALAIEKAVAVFCDFRAFRQAIGRAEQLGATPRRELQLRAEDPERRALQACDLTGVMLLKRSDTSRRASCQGDRFARAMQRIAAGDIADELSRLACLLARHSERLLFCSGPPSVWEAAIASEPKAYPRLHRYCLQIPGFRTPEARVAFSGELWTTRHPRLERAIVAAWRGLRCLPTICAGRGKSTEEQAEAVADCIAAFSRQLAALVESDLAKLDGWHDLESNLAAVYITAKAIAAEPKREEAHRHWRPTLSLAGASLFA